MVRSSSFDIHQELGSYGLEDQAWANELPEAIRELYDPTWAGLQAEEDSYNYDDLRVILDNIRRGLGYGIYSQAKPDQSDEIYQKIDRLEQALLEAEQESLGGLDELGIHMSYQHSNCQEFGIDSRFLGSPQRAELAWLRYFVGQTSANYQLTMQLLMDIYQLDNPTFTDDIKQKMIDRGYDKPQFSLYGRQAAVDFLDEQGFGSGDIQGNFLINFNLPKPLGRMWYRGGSEDPSYEIPEDSIAWGYFYRNCMSAMYSAQYSAERQGYFFDRINAMGQHDWRQYYYLYVLIGRAQS